MFSQNSIKYWILEDAFQGRMISPHLVESTWISVNKINDVSFKIWILLDGNSFITHPFKADSRALLISLNLFASWYYCSLRSRHWDLKCNWTLQKIPAISVLSSKLPKISKELRNWAFSACTRYSEVALHLSRQFRITFSTTWSLKLVPSKPWILIGMG